MEIFHFDNAKGKVLPILVSSPHSGTQIPKDIASQMKKEIREELPDTDFYVDELYAFAPAIGVALLSANYSRYVVDLNRYANSDVLYDEPGRRVSSLVAKRTFDGRPIYNETGADLSLYETERIDRFYDPYHDKIAQTLSDLRKEHSHVLLFDAHSIRSDVPVRNGYALADFMFGNANGQTCHPAILETALSAFQAGFPDKHSAKNDYFVGGAITRKFSNLENGIHTLQLEMLQRNYMDETTGQIKPDSFFLVQENLSRMFLLLAETLQDLAQNVSEETQL